eukprot:TRINITY_DN4242_c0_g2_i1.p1 TRINITY_DN4242_c0_g2~~TRINITY_DN4242_c0_g2_i1.p1  ORF type:complete len:871 (+),score=227.88 TRINITY_DN4242_c0_g2_i1:145-2613(+)
MSDTAALSAASRGTPRRRKYWVQRRGDTEEEAVGVVLEQDGPHSVAQLKHRIPQHFVFTGPHGPVAHVSAADLDVQLNGVGPPLADSAILPAGGAHTFVVYLRPAAEPSRSSGGLRDLWDTCLDDAPPATPPEATHPPPPPPAAVQAAAPAAPQHPELAALSGVDLLTTGECTSFASPLMVQQQQQQQQHAEQQRAADPRPFARPPPAPTSRSSTPRARRPSVAKLERRSVTRTPSGSHLPTSLDSSCAYEDRSQLEPIPHASSKEVSKALLAVKGSSTDWQKQIDGMTDCRRLATHHPALLAHSLNGVLLAVTEAMRSRRSKVRKTALLTVEDVAGGELRHSKAFDGQLDPLVSEVTKLAASDDVDMIREAARDCCDTIVRSVTDAQRLKVVTALLSQSTTARKNHTLRAQCVKFITVAVAELSPGEIHTYQRTAFLFRALGTFLRDANGLCRENARELGKCLCESFGGSEEFTAVLRQQLQCDADSLISALEPVGCTSPQPSAAPAPSLSPQQRGRPPRSPHTAARTRSPSPCNGVSESNSPPPPRRDSQRSAMSAAVRANGIRRSTLRSVSPDVVPHAPPSCGSPVKQKVCTGFTPAWGTPLMCNRCKQHKAVHGGRGGGGGGGDWETCSVTSRTSRLSRHSAGSRASARAALRPTRRPSQRVTPHAGSVTSASPRPPVARRSGSYRDPAAFDAVSARSVDTTGTGAEEFHRMIERQKADLSKKDELILKLVQENIELKESLKQEQTKPAQEEPQVSYVLITTPENELQDRSAVASPRDEPVLLATGGSPDTPPIDLRALEEFEAEAEALAAEAHTLVH